MTREYKRHLVTSALPYANGPLHIGHIAGAYLPADIYVRYLKMKETDTFLQAKLYGDSGTGDAEAIFDRAVLVRGRLPKDII